jgi:hypothetical protein
VRRGLDVCIVHARATAVVTQLLHSMPPLRRVVRRSYDHGASRRRRAARPSFAAATRSAGRFAARCNRPEICIATLPIRHKLAPRCCANGGRASRPHRRRTQPAQHATDRTPSLRDSTSRWACGMQHARATFAVLLTTITVPAQLCGSVVLVGPAVHAMAVPRYGCFSPSSLLAPTHTRALNNLWQTTCGTSIAPAPAMDRWAVCNA